MSVTQYTIPCGYKIPKLKDTVYFVSKSMAKIINIDNGTASVTINNPSPYPMSPTKLKGFNIRLNETESLDERYKFTKTLNISIVGHLTDASFLMDDDYFLVVEDYEGNFYLINVDFPSKMTYTYTLNGAQNQTDFTFTSNSNHPLLKLNWEIVKWENCKVYNAYGIKNIKLIEKGWARVDVEQDTITLFDNHTFKNVDFNNNSCTLTENYDGDKITNTISFDIPFDNVQSSWQYNLLEFKQNLYIAEILPTNSEHALLIGFENGLEPSYTAVGGTSNSDASKITITLEETSQRGLEELINWSVVENTNKKWVYIKEINHKNAFTCVGQGVARYDYMAEVDQDGNEMGNYKRFVDADASKFPYLNVVGTFDDVVTFQSSVCNCSDENVYKFEGHYYCIDGDKVQALESIHTYDCGQSGTANGTGSPLSDYTEIGNVVEESSDFCEDEVEYMWVLKTDVSECMVFTSRWVDSGYTCSGASGYDKYLVQKQQVWDDTEGWIDTDPLVTAATLVERNSEYCGYVPTPKLTLNGSVLYCDDSPVLTREEVLSLGYAATEISSFKVGTCVTSIGNNAFSGCTNMGLSDSLQEGLESIGSGAFQYCYNFRGNFIIPSTVTSLGSGAFSDCGLMTSINIPNGVTSIPSRFCYNCVNLENIEFGSGVTSIGEYAFESTYLKNLTIPDNVTSIGVRAFDYCQYLSAVTIGSGVTEIGSQAFYNQRNMTLVIYATTPPTLGSNVFWGISSIFVPCESVDTYKMAAGWSSYASIIQGIPPCHVSIDGKYELTLNNSTKVTAACDSSSAITSSDVYYPYSGTLVTAIVGDCVKSINDGAFYSCTALTSVDLGTSVTTIGFEAFRYCKNLLSVIIPDSVTEIGEGCFRSCSGMTSLDIGDGLEEISESAFSGCTALTSVSIGTGVTTIGDYAFLRCYSLPTITIPSGVTTIGRSAFYYCTGLTSVTINATTPPTLGNSSVFNNTSDCAIYVPPASVNTYKSASGWSNYSSRIQAIPT